MQCNELVTIIQSKLRWHKSRINFISLLLISLIRNRSISYSKNAVTLCKTSTNSNLRRIQRFFSGFTIDFDEMAVLIEHLISIKGSYKLSLDRTNWQFAGINFNILCLNVIGDGVALPLLWAMLDKRGNSDQEERIALMNRFIRLFGVEKIDCIIADREFIGQDWFNFLEKNPIKFYIRIRENMQFVHQGNQMKAFWWFNNLPLNQIKMINKPVLIKENWIYLSGMKFINKKGQIEFLIVATYEFDTQSISVYAQRWSIECFFKAIKSAGFNIEETHLTDKDRLEKLFAIVAFAFIWVYRIGEYQNQLTPITIQKHGRRQFSIFRFGLDNLIKAILFDYQQVSLFAKLLSCT